MSTLFDEVEKVWSGPKFEFKIDQNSNFGEIILQKLADEDSDRVMQINGDTGETMTKAEIRRRTIRCAQNLRTLGCTSDDRIVIIARNHHNLTPLLFALFCNGSPVTALDVAFVKDGASLILRRVEPSIVFCDADVLLAVKKFIDDIGLSAKLFTVSGQVHGFDGIDLLMIDTGVDEESFVCKKITDTFSHAATYLCTSGSSGPPKSICMSHGFLTYIFTRAVGKGLVKLTFSSFYWLSGVFRTIGSAFKDTRVFTSQPFSPDLFFDLVEKYQVQFFIGPPCQMQGFLKSERCKTANLSSFIECLSIGSHAPSMLIDSMKELIPHCMFMAAYGISETGGGVSVVRPKELEHCPNTVGSLIPGMIVKVISTTTNEKCGIGEEGEICVRMPIPVMGYLRDEIANQNAYDADGYFFTGDVGYFDELGRLFISGRKNETFKIRSFPIWPAEIEDVIQKDPAVRYACVVNVFDEEIGSNLIAAVVVKNEQSITAEAIYSLVADQLAIYKRLDGGVYFVDELPMTASNKVIRSKVKEIAQKSYQNKKQMQ